MEDHLMLNVFKKVNAFEINPYYVKSFVSNVLRKTLCINQENLTILRFASF